MRQSGTQITAQKDQIIRWYLVDRNSQDEILQRLREEYNIITSRRSLQRYLNKWDIYKNELNIDNVEGGILELFDIGLSYTQIIDHLKLERPEINLSLRSLQRKLRQWGKCRYDPVFYTEELVQFIRYFFYEENLRDDEILLRLGQWDLDINKALLIRIRIENNMKRKTNDPAERAHNILKVHEFFESYRQVSDAFGDLGRDNILGRVRRNIQLPATRDMVYAVYRQFYPEAVRQRANDRPNVRRRTRRKFTVPGPNYIWSMDGYHKLDFAGFEIYACIDAYSRKILWINVSRYNLRPSNILNQFLLTILELGIRPWYTRTDHGIETPLMAWAQFQLAMAQKPSIVVQNPDGTERIETQGYRISDSHKWGTSRQNRKIEQWWLQLLINVTSRWIDYFGELCEAQLFDKGNLADQVALYAIYGNMIRQEVADFVHQWNNHRIKFQPDKNHVVTGHVNMMWLNLGETGVRNYAVDLKHDPRLIQLAQRMREPLTEHDFNGFLALETQRLCDEWLIAHPLGPISDAAHPHMQNYMALKEYLEQHVIESREPRLEFNEIPDGGSLWYEQQLELYREDISIAQTDVLRNGDMDATWFNMNVHRV